MPEFTHRCKHCKSFVIRNDGIRRAMFVGDWMHCDPLTLNDYWCCQKVKRPIGESDVEPLTATTTVTKTATKTLTVTTQVTYTEQPVGRRFRNE